MTFSSEKAPHISRRDFLVCALLTAGLWSFAGRQSGLFAFGWIALAPLFYALSFCDAKTRRRRAFFAGWFCYALLNAWILPTIVRGGDAISVAPPVAALLGVLAVAIIGAGHGVQLWLVAWVFEANSQLTRRAVWLLPLLVAALWTAFDVLRTSGVMAHAWGALGYTQWRDYALLQSAAFVGQHGLTFLCVWFAVSLALWARRGDAVLWRAPLLVFALLHLFGAWQLHFSSDENAEKLRVLLVQTNASSEDKSRGDVAAPFFSALQLTNENARAGQFDVIVWPETTLEVRGLDAPPSANAPPDARAQTPPAPMKNFRRVLAPRAAAQNRPASTCREVMAHNDTERDAHRQAHREKACRAAAHHLAFLKSSGAPREYSRLAPFADATKNRARFVLDEVKARDDTTRGDFPAPSPPRAEELDALPSGANAQESEDENLGTSRDVIEEPREYSRGENAPFQTLEAGAGGLQLRAVRDLARRLQTRILCGALLYTRDGHLYNAAVLVDETGRVQVSAKERVVPFGERAPFGEMLPFLRRFAPEREVEVARSVTMLLPPRIAPDQAASTREVALPNQSGSRNETTSARRMAANSDVKATIFQRNSSAENAASTRMMRNLSGEISGDKRAAVRSLNGSRIVASTREGFSVGNARGANASRTAFAASQRKIAQRNDGAPHSAASTRAARFGALICFESCFLSPAKRLRSEGAQAFFVVTNDQWFSGTGAPWQHAAMAAMRAAENGVAVAQAGNGGYSFCVDRHGRFVLKTSLDTACAVAVSMPLAKAAP